MAIKVTCECGRNINLPDKYAGKKGKCPECGKTIPIPAEPAPAKESPPEPAKEPSPRPVQKKAAAGASPGAKPKFKGAAPRRKPIHKRMQDGDDGEGGGGEGKYKRKKSKKNLIIIVGSGAAVVVLVILYYIFAYLPAAFERRLDSYVNIYIGQDLEKNLTGFVKPGKHTAKVKDAIRAAADWRQRFIDIRLKDKPHLALDWEIEIGKEKSAVIGLHVGNEKMLRERWVKKGGKWYIDADDLVGKHEAYKLKKKKEKEREKGSS